ncbi:MAG: type II secretion system protein [Acidobacteriota bacterium]
MKRFSRGRRRAGRAGSSGFTLVEAVVSLALIAFMLLLAALVMAEQRRGQRQVDRHRQAIEVLDCALERVRAGALPLQSGWFPLAQTSDGTSDGTSGDAFEPGEQEPGVGGEAGDPPSDLEGALVHLEVEEEPAEVEGLYRVRVTVLLAGESGTDSGDAVRRSAETLVWRRSLD